MIRSGTAGIGSEHVGSRAGFSIRTRIALVRNEIAVGSVDVARLGLVGCALALQTAVLMSPGHFRPAGDWYWAVFAALGTLTSLGLVLVAVLPLRRHTTPRIRRALGLTALVSLSILSLMGVWHAGYGVRATALGMPPGNDGAVMDYYAAHQVIHGHNPYIKTNLVLALARLNAPSTTTTPLMNGQFRGARSYPSAAAVQRVFYNDLNYQPRTIPQEFESKYNYPSGSFLFILPFVALGITDMRFLYLASLVAIAGYLWFRMPRALKPFAPLVVLGNVPLIILTASGQPDPVYGVFLILGYAEWASPWLSPLSMGVAVGTKQLAWFFVPFYLLLVWREMGFREAVRRTALMGAVFTVMNAPFFLQSPSSYIASISGPMSDPMFPLGIGIIALFVSGALPMLPKLAFTLMEVVSWFGGMGAAARDRVLLGGGVAVLAALPLFFAWRSLVNYFYLAPVIALAILFAEPAQRRALRRLRGHPPGTPLPTNALPVPVAAGAD